MTYVRSTFRHPALPKNDLGYTVDYYEGSLSTLCAGCGHDSINAAIVQACWEMNIEPHKVAKLSGIGCSSKSPAYFLSNSHGFNSVHGRMPSVATGANLANRDLIYFGVSGDGDTASIGMGQFVHVIRRNLNMVYIVMNNGCYGLTKGQDSATADDGTVKGITMHDGSVLQLHKLSREWDPEDRLSAMNAIKNASAKHEILTGLLYMNRDTKDLHHIINTTDTPLNQLTEKDLCPGN